MKKHKVLSVFVIVGVVMLILGLLTTITGFAAGGRIDDNIDWPHFFRVTHKERVSYETEDIDYAIQSDVDALVVDVAIGDVKIVANSQNPRVEIRDYPKGVLNISETSGTLTIRDKVEYTDTYSHLWEITIYLSGSELNTATVDTDLGNVVITGITANHVGIDVDAGALTITDSVFSKLECDIDIGKAEITKTTVELLNASLDMGDFVFSGDITKTAEIENDAGNVDLDLDGAESTYYFVYSVDVGNASVNNRTSSAGINNTAAHGSPSAPVKISIDIDAGNLNITTQ